MVVAFCHIFMSTLRFFGPQYCCWDLLSESPDALVNWLTFQFNSDQLLSCVQLFATLWTAACQASLSTNNCQSPPTLTSIESVMPSNHLILCHPLLILPSIFPSIRVFSNESALRIRWPKYCSFSFSISPSNEHPGLISFRMDWLDLLAVQGTLKSLLQHHGSKASILWCSAFFIVQLSHPYMTTGKTIALTRQTFFDKVMSLLFNMLSRLVITFLPRSKPLLISWLQSPSAVILEPQKRLTFRFSQRQKKKRKGRGRKRRKSSKEMGRRKERNVFLLSSFLPYSTQKQKQQSGLSQGPKTNGACA